MRLLDGTLRFRLARLFPCRMAFGGHLNVIGRIGARLICLCTAATALVASALPTPTFEDASPAPPPGIADGVLIVGSIAGLRAGWARSPRPLFATFETGSAGAPAVSLATAGANQAGDEDAGLLDSQLEFVTIAGVAYTTGLGPDPATCGPSGGAPPCAAIYDGLVEAALAWANEPHYLVN